MPIVRFRSEERYLDAFEVVSTVGGPFRIKRPRTLVVNGMQFEALVRRGLAKKPSQVNLQEKEKS